MTEFIFTETTMRVTGESAAEYDILLGPLEQPCDSFTILCAYTYLWHG